MQECNIILDKLQVFERMYDAVRIVDPIRKKVLKLEGANSISEDIHCFKHWKKQELCQNCISIRAFNEDDTVYKLECKDDHIYMFTAVPVVIKGKRLVAEFLKKATNKVVMNIGENSQDSEILTTIEYVNRAAIKDPLTDLYNRRYINDRLAVDLINASARKEPLSIIFADLDLFKQVNDTYGHSAGDEVLKQFAKELKNYIRKDKDWVARYGGEEFLLCLSNTDVDTAKKIAEKIRNDIDKKQFIVNGERIHLTCSFGVQMVYGEEKDMTVNDVIELVDKRLYKAKGSGRNKVI